MNLFVFMEKGEIIRLKYTTCTCSIKIMTFDLISNYFIGKYFQWYFCEHFIAIKSKKKIPFSVFLLFFFINKLEIHEKVGLI